MMLLHGCTQSFRQKVASPKKALPYGERRPPTGEKPPQKKNHHNFIHGEQCSHEENYAIHKDNKVSNKRITPITWRTIFEDFSGSLLLPSPLQTPMC